MEPEEEEKTPFFVKVRLEALGGEEPSSEENPAYRLDAVDDRGQEQTSVTVLGDFPSCEEEQMPQGFVDGKDFETCFIYLVRAGGSIEEVKWESGPTKEGLSEYFENPVTWSAVG
ncbi:MAG TPA: hypothetical protein VMT37_04545 [Solirubrobacterales bacterium]|nr:hypothetical protein [Solirubrobacterales bacterium]